MPISSAPVQQVVGIASPITIATPAAGNCLVAVIRVNHASNTVTAMTGGGVTWVLGKRVAASSVSATEIWYGLDSVGVGTLITITCVSSIAANISEWSGVVTASALDQAGADATGTSTAPATASITTTNADDLLIAGTSFTSATYSTGPTNSFTRMTAPNSTSEAAYRVVGSTGSYSTAWTISASKAWAAAIISLKGVAAAGAMPRVRVIPQAVNRAASF